MLDQAARLRQMATTGESSMPSHKGPRVITVTSGKGGVGKSNFVVNLSLTLQKLGKKVMIFDADVGMGNDDVLLGFFPKYNVFDVILGNKSIDEAVIDGPYGIKLLPGGSGLNRLEEISEEQRESFIKKISCLDDLDYIIMDTGAGINRSILGFIACCDDLIIVTTPEPTSLTDAYSLVKAVSHFKIKSEAKVIVNRVLDEKEGIVTYDKFNNAVNNFLKMKLEHLGNITEDRKLIQSVRRQQPFVEGYPSCDAARDIRKIADNLTGSVPKSSTGASKLFKKIFNIFS